MFKRAFSLFWLVALLCVQGMAAAAAAPAPAHIKEHLEQPTSSSRAL